MEKRDKILMAAKTEFAEKGFSGARMGAISKKAGVNQALLHYYFDSKEKLYVELLHQLFGAYKTFYVEDVIEKWQLNPPKALYMGIYLLVNIHFAASDPDFNRIILREITEGRESLKYMMNDYLMPRIGSLEKIIINGRDEGYFCADNPLFTVLQILFFVLSLQNNTETYAGTGLYEKIYGAEMPGELFRFLINNTFRSLTPSGAETLIPEMPGEIINYADNIIERLKGEQAWYSSESRRG